MEVPVRQHLLSQVCVQTNGTRTSMTPEIRKAYTLTLTRLKKEFPHICFHFPLVRTAIHPSMSRIVTIFPNLSECECLVTQF